MHSETIKVRLPIESEDDIVTARLQARTLAAKAGFAGTDLTLITIATSELTRNLVNNAERGEILVSIVRNGDKNGISIVAQGEGPAVTDSPVTSEALSTARYRISPGLRKALRRMDEFELEYDRGNGTKVKIKKWVR